MQPIWPLVMSYWEAGIIYRHMQTLMYGSSPGRGYSPLNMGGRKTPALSPFFSNQNGTNALHEEGAVDMVLCMIPHILSGAATMHCSPYPYPDQYTAIRPCAIPGTEAAQEECQRYPRGACMGIGNIDCMNGLDQRPSDGSVFSVFSAGVAITRSSTQQYMYPSRSGAC